MSIRAYRPTQLPRSSTRRVLTSAASRRAHREGDTRKVCDGKVGVLHQTSKTVRTVRQGCADGLEERQNSLLKRHPFSSAAKQRGSSGFRTIKAEYCR
jgi:hypothetical protein